MAQAKIPEFQIQNEEHKLLNRRPQIQLTVLILGITCLSCLLLSTILIISNSVVNSQIYPLIYKVSNDVLKLTENYPGFQIPCMECPTLNCSENTLPGTITSPTHITSTKLPNTSTPSITTSTKDSISSVSTSKPIEPTSTENIPSSDGIMSSEPTSTTEPPFAPTTQFYHTSTQAVKIQPASILAGLHTGRITYNCSKYCLNPLITKAQLSLPISLIQQQPLILKTLISGIGKEKYKAARQKVAYLAIVGLHSDQISQVKMDPVWDSRILSVCSEFGQEPPVDCN